MKAVSVRGFMVSVLIAALVLPSWLVGPAAAAGAGGAVYVLTNAAAANAVAVFNRAADGTLSPAGTFATGGLGTGAGLGSQGAVALSEDGSRLFAVNAGSSEISSFAVQAGGLALVSTVPSGGSMPVSLSAHGGQVYVLNAGDSGNITGFDVAPSGALSAIPGSTRWLSNGGNGGAPGPAQVSFSRDGRALVVTEKATNLIDTYDIDDTGLPIGPAVYASAGSTPFGFAFGAHSTLVVSDAFGGAPLSSALSSYAVTDDSLRVISAVAPTHQTAACWVVVTGDGNYAYTTNAGSDSISGYRIGASGRLSLLDASGVTASTGTGSHPTDMGLSAGSAYLYALDGGTHAISMFRVQADGHLAGLGTLGGLPSSAVGLAAR